MATFVEDLRQRQLEAYESAFNEMNIEEMQGVARVAGAVVRAAAAAGWFTDLKPEDVGSMTGKETRQLFRDIITRHQELITIDPL